MNGRVDNDPIEIQGITYSGHAILEKRGASVNAKIFIASDI